MSAVASQECDYLLEVTRFTPSPAAESYAIESLEGLDDALEGVAEEATVVIALACDDGAGGAFFVFLSEGRACIHLTEGACWTASERTPLPNDQIICFRMDNGDGLQVMAEQTVTRQQGFQALRHWFVQGERWDEVAWRKL